MICPLCHHENIQPYHQDKRRDYFQCDRCHLVFVDPLQRLDSLNEKAVYDLHENTIDDAGYLRFLSRVTTPLADKLREGSKGLDFGSGPSPVLAQVLEQSGYDMSIYDVFYAPNEDVLDACYDFITCTEVIEHIYHPSETFPILLNSLKPEGIIAIMTKRVIDQEAFIHWHYKNDPTHVCFYSEKTFEFIAVKYGLHLDFVDKDVVFLTR